MTTWIAHHGMTSTEYQATFTKLVGDGYRLVEIDGYGENGQAHYAAIFAKGGGPAWIARHGLSASAFQHEFDTRTKDGYRLVEISGYSVNGETLYAAIFDKSTGPARVARFGMTSLEYQAWFNKLVSEGYRLRNVDGYAVGNEARFAAIFDKGTGPAWIARHGMTSDEYQREFDARVGEGYRLRLVSGYAVANQARYAAIFEEMTGPAWVSFHGMTASGYQTQFDKLVKQGYQSGLGQRVRRRRGDALRGDLEPARGRQPAQEPGLRTGGARTERPHRQEAARDLGGSGMAHVEQHRPEDDDRDPPEHPARRLQADVARDDAGPGRWHRSDLRRARHRAGEDEVRSLGVRPAWKRRHRNRQRWRHVRP